MANDNDHVIRKLNDLIELDFDAIEAYEAAVERLEAPENKRQLAEFCKDHERHKRDLANEVRRLGGDPSTGPDLMRYLTKGKVVLADMVGADHAILLAMRANEEVTNKRYELALAVDGMDAPTKSLVEANLADERRHRAWIEGALEADKTK